MNKSKTKDVLLLFRLARELHRNLVVSELRINQHATSQRYRKIQEISDAGGVSRSILHKKVRQVRASPPPPPPPNSPPPTSSTSHTSTTVTQNVAAKSSNSNVGMYLHVKKMFILFYFTLDD